MAFHDDLFPESLSSGSSGWPGYKTEISESGSGSEHRISRWDQPRHRYNVAKALKSWDDCYALLTFYHARQGAMNSFPFKDFLDHSTASNGRGSPGPTDSHLGYGDGTKTQFQLVKRYTSGGQTLKRTITLPVVGTVRVAFGGVEQLSGWTVSRTSGIVTFSTPPAASINVTAGFEFHVPVRFGRELEVAPALSLDGYDAGSFEDVPLVEVKPEVVSYNDYNYGGASAKAISGDITLSLGDGIAIALDPLVDNVAVHLPDPTHYTAGYPYWQLYNESATNNFKLKKPDGTDLVTVAPGQMADLALVLFSGGEKVWYAI